MKWFTKFAIIVACGVAAIWGVIIAMLVFRPDGRLIERLALP